MLRVVHFGEYRLRITKKWYGVKKEQNKTWFPLEDSDLTKVCTSGFYECIFQIFNCYTDVSYYSSLQVLIEHLLCAKFCNELHKKR